MAKSEQIRVMSSEVDAVLRMRVATQYVVLDKEMGLVALKVVQAGGGVGGGAVVPKCLEHVVAQVQEQGLVKLADVLLFQEGKLESIPKWEGWRLVAPETIEKLKSECVGELLGELCREKRPFDAVVEGRLGVEDVYWVDGGDHTIKDRKGRLVPVVQNGDYIHGRFRDGCYDLFKVVKLLGADSRVVAAHNSYRKDCPLEVSHVPSYNAERGCHFQVEFLFCPTEEDMLKLEAASAGRSVASEFWEIAFEIDLLGLRAGGAAYFDTYYGEKEYSRAQRDTNWDADQD